MLLKSFRTSHFQMMNGLETYSRIELVHKREMQKVQMKPTFGSEIEIGYFAIKFMATYLQFICNLLQLCPLLVQFVHLSGQFSFSLSQFGFFGADNLDDTVINFDCSHPSGKVRFQSLLQPNKIPSRVMVIRQKLLNLITRPKNLIASSHLE